MATGRISVRVWELMPDLINQCDVGRHHRVPWEQVDRVYTKVTLRHNMVDMGRWCGLKFENLNCVPETYMEAEPA